MDDTAPEVGELMAAMLMRRSGEERFIMGALMFDAARELVIASLPQDLPPPELKCRLFERMYGFPLAGDQACASRVERIASAESK